MWFAVLVTQVFAALVSGAATDTLLSAVQNTDDCPSCLALLSTFQTIALTGTDAFITAFTSLCIEMGTDDPDVCTGIIGLEGPILAHDLRMINTTGQTAEKLCDALLGMCVTHPINPFTVPFPKSPPSNPKKFVSRGRPPIRVAHLSDVHIDRMYTVGSEANCTKSICCRDFPDSPAIPTEPALPNGNLHCDSPISLGDSMLEEVERLNPRFSIFTGDGKEATTDLKAFNEQMASKLSAPIFPSIGNHDTAPVNAFARSTSHTTNNSQFVFDIQSAGWEQWIGPTAAFEVDHNSGSYWAQVPGLDLRIIAVNTQYWYKQNFWLYDSDVFQPDPNGIIAFLVDALQAAEDAGDRAWIIGHIPLGKEDTMQDQSNYYDQVLQRYINTIAGQFFGHSHKDQFEIAYSNYSEQTAANAVSVGLIGPALTPSSGNPAFKFYDIDPDTFSVVDSSVIFTNLSDPEFPVRPTWGLYYSARETYGPLVGLAPDEPLSPAFWHNLTEVFAVNETAFQMFNTFISRGGAVTACDADCQNTTICDMRAFRSQNNCDTPTPGLSLRRRATASHEHDACEGSGLAYILSGMVEASRSRMSSP
ncbi:Saposin B-type domain-containing protein [Mycena sanguinolenta]|uniref:Sphingomyelin phosphodiesterase n=1 Tax=Mycena sanguinolenta TaxID=230812 RepID=A0A8H6XUH5_9AGAR|nr:Saposin B-type domain-containing protein [Mycena sanguinolenta]